MKAYLSVTMILFSLVLPFLVACTKEESKNHKEESLEEFLAKRKKNRKPVPPPGQVLNREPFPAPKQVQGK